MQVKGELIDFIERLDNGRMRNIFNLPYFNKAYIEYFTNKKSLDLKDLIDKYDEIGITENDLITLTKLIDFINYNNKHYRPINKDKIFGLSIRFSSTYENMQGLKIT